MADDINRKLRWRISQLVTPLDPILPLHSVNDFQQDAENQSLLNWAISLR